MVVQYQLGRVHGACARRAVQVWESTQGLAWVGKGAGGCMRGTVWVGMGMGCEGCAGGRGGA